MSKAIKNTKLNVKYGDILIITSGFFRGLSGKCIDFAPKQENIYSVFGIQTNDSDERQYKENSYQIKLDDSGAKHWFFENDLKKSLKKITKQKFKVKPDIRTKLHDSSYVDKYRDKKTTKKKSVFPQPWKRPNEWSGRGKSI